MMKTYSRKRSGETNEVIINLNELCRLCLSKGDELVPIFNDEESIPLPLRIMACVALEVVEDDGLPNTICSACKYQLEKSYNFRKKCEISDLKLRRHLKLISGTNKLLEDEDEIEYLVESKTSEEELSPNKADKPTTDRNLEVKQLFEEILVDESNEETTVEVLDHTVTERELLGATITYIQQPENEVTEDPENITLSMDMEQSNKEACTLKTEMKDEIIDMEQPEEDLDMSQVYFVDLEANPEEQGDEQNYESIAELVKSTLSSQPGFGGGMQVKLHSTGPGDTTQVQVTTEDGSVMVMELMTEEETPQLMQQDDEGELKIWQCPNCPKAFARRIQLNRHSSVHMEQRGFSCGVCEKWFPTRSALVRHERIHTGEKPFECGICKRCFAQKEVLYRHLMTHSGEKPYQCPHCDKGFTQREALRSHLRTHIKPNPNDIQIHRCALCPKVFCHASGLSRHLVTHTGKTFKCRDCDKSFSDKSSLRRHHKITFHQA